MNAITPEMQKIIDARVQSIREAHANCLLEGIDMGHDVLNGMLARAREPVSNEEFKKREYALLFKEYGKENACHKEFLR